MTLFPDYSETLDGESMEKYNKIPEGGTTIAALRASGSAAGQHRVRTNLAHQEDGGIVSAGSASRFRAKGSDCPSGCRRAMRFLRRWKS